MWCMVELIKSSEEERSIVLGQFSRYDSAWGVDNILSWMHYHGHV